MGTDPSSSIELQEPEREKEKPRRREELGLYPGWRWEAPESENGWKLFQLFWDEDSETDDEDE